MAKVHDKVKAQGFKVAVPLSSEEVLAAAEDAAQRSGGVVDKVMRTDTTDTSATYAVKRGGMKSLGTFKVTTKQLADTADAGESEVTLSSQNFTTVQTTYMYLPIGPKTSAFLPPYRRFSEIFRKSLEGAR